MSLPYPAQLEIDYPEGERDRVTALLRLLTVLVAAAVIIAWFSILVTGRYPRGMFDFVVGVHRWWLRVMAYAYLLATDTYPPFRL